MNTDPQTLDLPAAAAAYDAAAYSATKKKVLKACADIVQTFYPELPT